MNSSIKSDSNHHRSSYTTFLNELHASVRHRRVEATVTPLQQFSVRTKPVKTNLQIRRTQGLRDLPHTIEDSRQQPRSILPLNMIVSDIASRVSMNCNSESPSIDEKENSQLLKIKNKKRLFKLPKCDKFLMMFHEKCDKMYPTHLIKNERNHKVNSEDTKLSRQPLNSYLDNAQENINENLLTTPLRQQCNSFSQFYRRQYFDSEKTWSTDSRQLPVYDNDQINRAKQAMNIFITSEDFLYPSILCSISTPNFDQPLSERCSTDSDQEYTQKSCFSSLDNFHPGCNDDKQNRINIHENFVFNPVFYKGFEEISKDDLDESIVGSVSEWSSDSASCTDGEPMSTMDSTMFKRIMVEEMLTFTVISESTKKKIHIPKQYIVENEE